MAPNTLPFALPGLEADGVEWPGDRITIFVRSTALQACCPECEQSTASVRSHDHRRPRDLPVSSQASRLVIRARRFRCRDPSCPQLYGAVLDGLEQHRVVDRLPDRTVETSAERLKAHPGVQIIARDRSSE